jgi:hypothetical protein
MECIGYAERNMTLYTDTLECAGDCGSKIEVTSPYKNTGDTGACAEALGWATVDKGKKQEVYCPSCQVRARRIVKTIGMRGNE